MQERQAEPEIMWSPRLGAHLEALRKQAGWRRVDLAHRLGVSEETVRLWERGAVQPSAERMARLIALLSLDATSWTSAPEPLAEDLPVLAQRLRQERAHRTSTQAEAAITLGVSQTTLAAWESGRTTPSAGSIQGLAAYLGLADGEAHALCEPAFVVDTTGWSPFGERIGARREALRLTRGALAERLGVSEGTVVRWELGYRTPSSSILPLLASELDVPVEDLADLLPRRSVGRLGELVQARQRELGMRSIDLAQQVGATQATVSRWINGHSQPGQAHLRRLATALNVPYGQLLAAAEAPSGVR